MNITHIGTATTLLEIAELRVLTDPAFDPAGSRYRWAPIGGSSEKYEEPSLPASAIGACDVALVTHAQHDDNLDPAGRTLLASAKRVLTTRPSARRIGGHAEGLRPGEHTEVVGSKGTRLRITATDARHGPPWSLPFVGAVIGFVIEWEGQSRGALYISGDTVFFRGVEDVARRFKVGLALLHMGEAKLPIMGPFRLTMNGEEAARAARLFEHATIVPVHYDGWKHFSEPRARAEKSFHDAGVSERVKWIEKGKAVAFDL